MLYKSRWFRKFDAKKSKQLLNCQQQDVLALLETLKTGRKRSSVSWLSNLKLKQDSETLNKTVSEIRRGDQCAYQAN